MADTFTTITTFISSPPGQLAAGAVLAGIVWKFFERVENLLTDQAKFEIAVWLVGRKRLSTTLERWPDTFTTLFDRLFGSKRASWGFFARSCVASYCSLLFVVIAEWLTFPDLPTVTKPTYEVAIQPGFSVMSELIAKPHWILPFLSFVAILNLLPDLASLLETRWILNRFRHAPGPAMAVTLLLIDLLLTGAIAYAGFCVVANVMLLFGAEPTVTVNIENAKEGGIELGRKIVSFWAIVLRPTVWFYPTFFTSIWLWLYAASGFILKAARRFDIGFDGFNRKFDIEKKPLQSMGLVAGALVALIYWGAVLIRHFVS